MTLYCEKCGDSFPTDESIVAVPMSRIEYLVNEKNRLERRVEELEGFRVGPVEPVRREKPEPDERPFRLGS